MIFSLFSMPINAGGRNSEENTYFGSRQPAISEYFNLSNLIFFKFRIEAMLYSKHFYSVLNIFETGYYFKIFYPIVFLISIFVVNLHLLLYISNKGYSHKLVNFRLRNNIVFRQMDAKISSAVYRLKNSWLSSKLAKPSHTSKVANFVQSFMANYFFPFFHERIISRCIPNV